MRFLKNLLGGIAALIAFCAVVQSCKTTVETFTSATEVVTLDTLKLTSVTSAESSDESVAVVEKTDAGIIITSKKEGTCTLTLKQNNTKIVKLTVYVNDEGKITTELKSSETIFNFKVIDVTLAELNLKSVSDVINSDGTVAAASKTDTGITITSKKAGTCTITVKESDVKTASVAITVAENGDITKTVTAFGQITITGTVTISGTLIEGQKLTAVYEGNAGTSVSYQWYAGDTAITGAAASEYTLTSAEIGKTIKVVVTGTGDYTGAVTSAETAVVKIAFNPQTEAVTLAELNLKSVSDVINSDGTVAAASKTDTGITITSKKAGTCTITVKESDVKTASVAITVAENGSFTKTVTAFGRITITGTVTISGTLIEGQKLTAVYEGNAGTSVSYQWYAGDTAITGAAASEYTLTSAEIGKTIKVVVTGTGDYTGAVTSAETAVVKIAFNPQTEAVTLAELNLNSVSAVTSSDESVAAASKTDTGITITSKKAGTCTITVKESDVKTASVAITVAENGSFTKTVTAFVKITITGTAAISGTAQVGQKLTATYTVGTAGETYTYQWYAGDSAITGATASEYTLTSAEAGKAVKVVVTGTGDYTGTVTSSATSSVTKITITGTAAISGTAQVGQKLTAKYVMGNAGSNISYQWYADDTAITGATSAEYTLTSAEAGKAVKVVVTGTGDYTGTVTSSPTIAVTKITITGTVAISGTAAVGQTLTATYTVGTAGETVSYKWYSGNETDGYTEISGATGSTYTLTASEAVNYVKVTVSGTGDYTGDCSAVTSAKVLCVATYSFTETVKELAAGTDGTAGTTGTYVQFGDWPKTIAASTVKFNETAETNGYYIGSDGNYYAKVTVVKYSDNSTYSDGTTAITAGNVNYFKVEPIKWRVVTTSYTDAASTPTAAKLLVAENVLTSNIEFYINTSTRSISGSTIKPDDYKFSQIRAYLNGSYESTDTQTKTYTGCGFLQKAFTSTAQGLIKSTVVDNSLASTGDSTNVNICDNCTDRVFILSKAEAANGSYFSSSDNRSRSATDYAIANNANQSGSTGCNWWLRTPYKGGYESSLIVGANGNAGSSEYNVNKLFIGIVPALCISN